MTASSPPLPPRYARALRFRVYALSLWLGRLALAPLGLAPLTEPLLALPVAVGAAGAILGPLALWDHDRPAALAEALAVAVSLIPASGWMGLAYGPPPVSDAGLPLGTDPWWLAAAGMAWLIALAYVSHRSDAMHAIAWVPSMALLTLDLPPAHRYVFALAPRLADALAPLAMVLAIFALARLEKRCSR